jgi:hypothetical protein
VREAGPGRIRPGLTPAGDLERGVLVELAALVLAAVGSGAPGLGDRPAQGGGDLVGLDLDHRALVALGVSQDRDLRRPMTTARSPLLRDSATCSASCRHTLTRKKLVSPSRQVSPSLMRAVTASFDDQRGKQSKLKETLYVS